MRDKVEEVEGWIGVNGFRISDSRFQIGGGVVVPTTTKRRS